MVAMAGETRVVAMLVTAHVMVVVPARIVAAAKSPRRFVYYLIDIPENRGLLLDQHGRYDFALLQ